MFNMVGPPVPLTEMKAVTKEKHRLYEVGEGKWYPSVTTVTGHKKVKDIVRWRKRVGEEEANKISGRATARGNKFHSMVECYLKNEEVKYDEKSPLAYFMFKTAKETLNRINNIHLLESPLYSDKLMLAGRVDCIAEFDNTLSVIDFKTSTKVKKEAWIENYFVQGSAYSQMYKEHFDEDVNQVVILITTEQGTTQVFKKNPHDYLEKLKQYVEEFYKTIP